MPPTDRFVISFAAEPPQEPLPYGRWADTLAGHFVAACHEVDTEGEDVWTPEAWSSSDDHQGHLSFVR